MVQKMVPSSEVMIFFNNFFFHFLKNKWGIFLIWIQLILLFIWKKFAKFSILEFFKNPSGGLGLFFFEVVLGML